MSSPDMIVQGGKGFNLRNFEGKEGQHATPSEVSVTKYLRQEAFVGKPTAPGEVQCPDIYRPLTADEMRAVYPATDEWTPHRGSPIPRRERR